MLYVAESRIFGSLDPQSATLQITKGRYGSGAYIYGTTGGSSSLSTQIHLHFPLVE